MSHNKPLLTFDDVLAKRRDIAEREVAINSLLKQLEADKQRFAAMLYFVVDDATRENLISNDFEKLAAKEDDLFPGTKEPADTIKPIARPKLSIARPAALDANPFAPVRGFTKGMSEFIGYIGKITKPCPDGITHADLMSALLRSPHSDRVKKNSSKSYYKTTSKMLEDHILVRHGNRLYHTVVYENLRKNGALPSSESASTVRPNTSGYFILNALELHPEGLTAIQLKDELSKFPNAPESLIKHRHFIYNVLATLIGAGEVLRNDGLYSLAKKEKPRVNEASDLHASGKAR